MRSNLIVLGHLGHSVNNSLINNDLGMHLIYLWSYWFYLVICYLLNFLKIIINCFDFIIIIVIIKFNFILIIFLSNLLERFQHFLNIHKLNWVIIKFYHDSIH